METLGVGLIVFIVIVLFGILLAVSAWLLKALTLRCACDLWAVDPSPGFLRCLVVTTLLWPILASVMAGALVVASILTLAFKPSPENSLALNVALTALMFLPVSLVVSLIAFVVAFRANRVGIVSGFVVWLLDTLLYGLISAVLALLVMGIFTVIESVSRTVHIIF